MRCSDTLAELAKALCQAQAKLTHASKSSINPHFKSKYADLAEVWDAIREPLTSHGLSIVQLISSDDQAVTVSVNTRMLHASGEWIESTLTMKPTKSDPQGMGSAITYARRYALAAICGIAQDDDDANAASVKTEAPKKASDVNTDAIYSELPDQKVWLSGKFKELKVPPSIQRAVANALVGKKLCEVDELVASSLTQN